LKVDFCVNYHLLTWHINQVAMAGRSVISRGSTLAGQVSSRRSALFAVRPNCRRVLAKFMHGPATASVDDMVVAMAEKDLEEYCKTHGDCTATYNW
jgi:hypothetical protein